MEGALPGGCHVKPPLWAVFPAQGAILSSGAEAEKEAVHEFC